MQNARAIADRIYKFINVRQHDGQELEQEIKRIESEIESLSQSSIPPIASTINRIRSYVARDSLLGRWISSY
ncbi:MAG TPA: hypothetical protein EYP59_16320 [Thiotrichaceae bacterium]|nr:hypothetical protein [Thiotrichaceae bacterium]